MAHTIRQIRRGRLAAHQSSPIDGVSEAFKVEDWTPRSGVTVSISGGNLRFAGGSSITSRANRFTKIAARSDMFIQATLQARATGGTMGIFGRTSAADVSGVADDWIQATISTGFSGPRAMVEKEGGTTIQSNNSANDNESVPYRVSLKCFGTDAAAYFHGDSEERALSGLGLTEAGWAALCYSSGSANTMDYANFFLMTSHLVTVRGPNTTWRARVKNAGGTVLAEADAVAGVAQVDLFAARVTFPDATRIEIYDPVGATVLCSFDPGARVWGGDEWVYYADDPAPGSGLTRNALGRRAAYNGSPTTGVDEAFDTADWADSGPGALSIVSGNLRYTNAGSDGDVNIRELGSDADGPDHFVQAVLAAGSAAGTAAIGVAGRLSDDAPGSLEFVILRGTFFGTLTFGIVERAEPTTLVTDTVSASAYGGIARVSLEVVGSAARGFDFSKNLRSAVTGLTLSPLWAGLWKGGGSAGNVRDWSAYYRMPSATLTVNGPDSDDWRAVIRTTGGDMLAEADGSAGVAALDLFEARVRFPQPAILEIIDLADAERAPLHSAAPSERLWGGDVWTWLAPPEAPTNFEATFVGATTVGLDWDDQADADSFVLERATAEEGPYTEVDEVTDSGFTDTGLTPLTTYFYRLKARNAAGDSDYTSPPVEVTTLDIVPDVPAAPTVGSPTASSLAVSWAAVPFATAYDVWRSLTEVGGYEIVHSGAGTSFVDSGLDPETTYFYRVSACSSLGCSLLSAPGSGTTAAVASYPPCTLLLEVYDADGTTIAWEVATDRAHPFPYLLFPSNYGSREIDPVAGAASIATVDVTIADVAQTPGDQRTGFVTERLSGIFGRRCRLRRFISETLGWYTIADGPAGSPRLSDTYAGYVFSIRDVRETERRLRPFSGGGTTALVPLGPLADWGDDGDGNYLLEAVEPVIGKTLIQFNSTAGEWVGQIQFNDLWDFLSTPGTPQFPAALLLSEDAEESLKFIGDGVRAWFPNADVLWRLAGSSDPYNVARPDAPIAYAYRLGGVQPGVIEGTTIAGNGLLSLLLYWSASGPPAGFPTEDGVELEVILRHRGPATEELPYYYEGTLGDLLAKLYDRELERAPLLGGDVYDPQGLDTPPASEFGGGVRYDPAALAALTTPVLLRATEAIDDGRSWAESNLYAPSGFIPSIDAAGLISPVSRARPSAITGPEINDGIAEPAPDWNAGERVVNVVRYTYRRYFIPGALARIEVAEDGIATRDVVIEFRDPESVDKHGEQVVDFDASAFGAIGAPATSVVDPGGLPIEGVPETGAILAADARYEVLERYRDGAPAFRVAVRRSDVPALRDGDYVPADLSWLPDLSATLRGLAVEAVQVLSIEGLDCEWLTLLLEVTPIVAEPGYYSNGEKTGDDPVPGFYDNPDLISDEPGGS
jgi:hypothetical protein